MTDQARPVNADEPSTGELIHQLTEQMSRLVRDEMKLAQAEMSRKGTRLAIGAGLFGGSSVIALYATGCLLAAAVAGLATVLATWLAALIVGVALLMCAGVVALAGKRKVSAATPLVPQETMHSVQLDAETITERARQ
ncbi:MAG TPA: phage holin family protein [Streptosporangiaceae bacterium]|nr:phage holin family protein [Streptosporangiaceae bacterium]